MPGPLRAAWYEERGEAANVLVVGPAGSGNVLVGDKVGLALDISAVLQADS
jgi:ATP-dependent protease Clp ATPase subunit